MSVTTGGLEKGLKRAEGAVSAFESRATSLKGVMVGLAGALALREIGRGIAGGIVSAVQASSSLNEQISKTRTVFGDSAGIIDREAQRMGDAFGYPKREFYAGASNIGLIAKGAGLAQGEAAKMGASFAVLAANAGSFFDVPVDVALEKIRAGLTGESEPLRAFGVLLNEDAVKTEALRLGLAKMGEKLTETAKMKARASLITKGLADADGDLERTSRSTANQMRMVWGRLENAMADVGTAIQPVTDAVLTLANTAVARLGQEILANREAVFAWAKEAAGGGSAVFAAFEKAGKGLAAALDVIDAGRIVFKDFGVAAANLEVSLAKLEMGWYRAGLAVEEFFGTVTKETATALLDAAEHVIVAQKAADKITKEMEAALVEKGFGEKFRQVFDDIKNAAMDAVKPVVQLGDATKAMAQALAGIGGRGLAGVAQALAIGNAPRGMAAAGAAADKIKTTLAGLKEDIATFGTSAGFQQAFKLKAAGATDKELGEVTTLGDILEGLNLKESLMKPLDVFEKQMTKLRELRESRAIDYETYSRGVKGARKTYYSAVETPGANAAAVIHGSQEAYAAQVRAVQGVRMDEPIKDVADNTAKTVTAVNDVAKAINAVFSKATGAPFAIMPMPT